MCISIPKEYYVPRMGISITYVGTVAVQLPIALWFFKKTIKKKIRRLSGYDKKRFNRKNIWRFNRIEICWYLSFQKW